MEMRARYHAVNVDPTLISRLVTVTYPSDSRSRILTVASEILSPTFTRVDSTLPAIASPSVGIQTTQGCGLCVIHYIDRSQLLASTVELKISPSLCIPRWFLRGGRDPNG